MLRKFLEARIAVAALIAVIGACVVALCAISGRVPEQRYLLILAAVPAICFVPVFFHLRQFFLSFVVVAAPVFGLAIVVFYIRIPLVTPAFAYLTGHALALFLADEISARVLDGEGVAGAISATLQENIVAICAGVAAATILPALMLLALPELKLSAFAALAELAAGLGALIIVPLAASLVPFGEDTIVRLNRLREARAPVLERLTAVAGARWGWSVSGIAIVFLVLAVFGARTLHVTAGLAQSPMLAPLIAALAATVLLAGFAAARDWRRAIAIGAAFALADCIGAWGYQRMGVVLTGASWLALMQILDVGLVLMALAANAARPDEGEDAEAASARAILGKTGALVMSFVCAIAVLFALSLSLRGQAVALLAAGLFAGLGAALFQPAFAAAIESLIPRRSTIAARYRVS